jgi:hypothetical protein
MTAPVWGISHWSGGRGTPEGYYLERQKGPGQTEWLLNAGRPVRFDTRAEAEAFVAATPEAQALAAAKRLREAAPALLEALQSALAAMLKVGGNGAMTPGRYFDELAAPIDAARAAIAKARQQP